MEDDDVADFFDFGKPFKRHIISGGYCNGNVVGEKLNIQKIPERTNQGSEYAAKYSKAEEARLLESWVEDAVQSSTSRMDDVDDISSMAEEDKDQLQRIRAKELMEPIFNRYDFNVLENDLTIHKSKKQIVDTIRANPVVVLQGMTGCGKTTQVPQYLLEDAYKRKEWCNIIVTQPRRIAATSIAKRVAQERSCELGTLVGFKVGLKEMLNEDTRLLYVTTGVLLNFLISSKSLSRFSHIILDEVHEREVDMDFLLIIVRRLLASSRNTKIIVMSATMESLEFATYFKIPGPNSLIAPQLAVSNTHQHDVSVFYLDDLEKLQIDFSIKYEQPDVHEKMYSIAAKLVLVCDRFIDEFEKKSDIDYKPSIIIFLPGIHEIERMAHLLQMFLCESSKNEQKQSKFTILKLHSILPSEEQAFVFRKPPPNHRKVILATNMAESSITIPDVKYVIDFCLQRILVADTLNNFTTLRTQWASKNNCVQRAGRAGRIMNGRVYRLVSKYFYEHGMAQSIEPEMVRCPLGNVVLKTKRLDMGAPHTILALAMSPPNLSNVSNTVLQLKELGALLRTANGVYDPQDGDLTYLGNLMALLPLDLHLAKLVVLGYVFAVLDEAIIIAAGMNVKNIFRQVRTITAYTHKRRWADGSCSDGIAILNAYNIWRLRKEQGTASDAIAFCQRYQLDIKSLSEMAELVQEIKFRLGTANVRTITGANRIGWSDREKTVVLKVVMAGAFYPNYFLPTMVHEHELCDRKIYTEVGGRDPFNTVMFSGFDHANYIGPLYRQQIKSLLTEQQSDPEKHACMKVEFERGANKIFVTFSNPTRKESDPCPDRIHPLVYDALKLRQVRHIQTELNVMHHLDAISFATRKQLGEWRDNEWHPRSIRVSNPHLSVEPPIHVRYLTATVTHVVHPNMFYLHPHDQNEHILENIEEQLNGKQPHSLRPFPAHHVFHTRDIVAAPLHYTNGIKMARAKLLIESKNSNVCEWMVFFLDHGTTKSMPVAKFRQLANTPFDALTKIPSRVFEASLVDVQPSAVRSPNDVWTPEAIQHFRQLVLGKRLHVEIYSVANRLSTVTLRREPDCPIEQSINRELIASHHGQLSEESFVSKMDHEKRRRVQLDMELDDAYRQQILNDSSERTDIVEDDEMLDLELPEDLLKVRLTLRGPYSPLEVKCTSAIFSGYRKPVKIESESINSVLLDTNPQNPYDKMLVAAGVNETNGNLLIARLTSMMPSIPGFPVLMALIFAPTCLLKKDAEGTRVIGLLAGLGCTPHTGRSIYPEHDLSLAVDVSLTEEDIADINALRYSMDSILQGGHNEQTSLLGEYSIESLMIKVKDYLIKILQRERNVTNNRSLAHDFNWTMGESSAAGSSSKRHQNPMIDIYSKSIFPLHDNLNLRPIPDCQIQFLQRHCKELRLLTQSLISLPKGGITCKLCNVAVESQYALRIHFYSKLHRDLEMNLNIPH